MESALSALLAEGRARSVLFESIQQLKERKRALLDMPPEQDRCCCMLGLFGVVVWTMKGRTNQQDDQHTLQTPLCRALCRERWEETNSWLNKAVRSTPKNQTKTTKQRCLVRRTPQRTHLVVLLCSLLVWFFKTGLSWGKHEHETCDGKQWT